ncbi:MAG: hypothetical protein ACOC2Y_02910 [Spirochaetota bacterium]
MKKTVLIAFIAIVAAGTAIAQPRHGMGGRRGSEMWGDGPYRREAERIMNDYADRVPGDLTFAEIDELAGRLSIPAQKRMYVGASSLASFFAPGLGQFINGDALGGSLFMLGSTAIKTGTLVGIYFLLPEEVRFSNLDYWNDSKSEITSTWDSALGAMSVADYVSVFGVAAGGMLVDHILARLSARHAGNLARERIASGEVEFRPRPEIILGPGGTLGFGLRMGY